MVLTESISGTHNSNPITPVDKARYDSDLEYEKALCGPRGSTGYDKYRKWEIRNAQTCIRDKGR